MNSYAVGRDAQSRPSPGQEWIIFAVFIFFDAGRNWASAPHSAELQFHVRPVS